MPQNQELIWYSQKEELQNLEKEGLTINEYMLKINILTDDLQSTGYVVLEEEKPMYILRGLDENFDDVFFYYK